MNYLNLKKTKYINWWKLINTSKINFIYPKQWKKDWYRLHGQCVGFQDLIFILNFSRVSEFFISKGTMFHSFGPTHLSALKRQLIVFIDLNWKSVLWTFYWIFFCSKISCFIGASRFSFVLYSSVANILIFLHELLQNYLFLEVFQILTHSPCNRPKCTFV